MDNMFSKIGECAPDNLFAGHDIPVLIKGITLAKGQGVISRGSVLGIVTTTGLAKLVDSTKTDGTEKANCIATDTIDTGDETATDDVKTTAYTSGLFNKAALTYGGTDTAANHELRLRELGIYLKESISY